MKTRTLKSDLLLLTTSAIWGFAFVAQRVGMEYIGPFLFNTLRFALGTLVLVPVYFYRKSLHLNRRTALNIPGEFRWYAAFLAGFILFAGAGLQQTGMIYTTAGKGGFITGLYVLLVPVLGLLQGKRSRQVTWLGAILAVVGLYLLSVTESWSMQKGDLLVLGSAFFWAMHVQLIDGLVDRMDAIELAVKQFAVCAGLSLIVALLTEPILYQPIQGAAIPLFYAGALSVGIAYTLQIVGQREAHPSHAAIIMSLEAVFAVMGGALLLGERLTLREWLGATLMLSGMVASQLGQMRKSHQP